MNTEVLKGRELSDEELDRVTGGVSLADVATVALCAAVPGGLVILASDAVNGYIEKRL
jgi:hypothetical protein